MGLIHTFNLKRELIHSFKIKSIIEDLPFIINTWSFEAKVPYTNKGWSNSVDLSKENQEKLIVEAKQIRLILNEGNYNQYLKLLGNRDNEVFISIYADKEYMINRILKSKNNMADIELYKVFCTAIINSL